MKHTKELNRKRRHWRVRTRVSGTAARPRLAIRRSNKFIYAQLIDDVAQTTVVAASSNQKALVEALGGKSGATVAAAKLVGKTVADRAKEKGVTRVAFDRGGYKYHGRVKALADAAREAGLEF